MAAFDFTANFSAVPTGPLMFSSLPALWPQPGLIFGSQTSTRIQEVFEIVPNGGKTGGPCGRMKYPAGVVSAAGSNYQFKIGSPGVPVNVEFDLLHEPGFDFTGGPGKTGPAIQWGSEASGPIGGTRAFIIWQSGTTATKKRNTILQDQRNGGQLCQPPVYTPTIVPNVWDHWRIQMMGGPAGWVSYWLNGVLQVTVTSLGNAQTNDPAAIDFAYFYGGGAGSAGHIDSFVRHDNLRVYSSPAPFPDASAYIATFTKG